MKHFEENLLHPKVLYRNFQKTKTFLKCFREKLCIQKFYIQTFDEKFGEAKILRGEFKSIFFKKNFEKQKLQRRVLVRSCDASCTGSQHRPQASLHVIRFRVGDTIYSLRPTKIIHLKNSDILLVKNNHVTYN